MDNETVLVELPGTMTATYKDGVVTGLIFSISANYAGYFGPPAIWVDGPGENLKVEEDDSPFWDALSKAIHATKVEWE